MATDVISYATAPTTTKYHGLKERSSTLAQIRKANKTSCKREEFLFLGFISLLDIYHGYDLPVAA
jgi:hypothetical protein